MVRDGLVDDVTALRHALQLQRRYDPDQPRDRDGQWTAGMPSALVSLPAAAGRATVSRLANGRTRLAVGDRSVDLSVGRNGETGQLRSIIIAAADPDGVGEVHRLNRYGTRDRRPTAETLVSIRPVPGRFVTDRGREISSPDEARDDEDEVFVAEHDIVVGEGSDTDFDDEPSIRVSDAELNDILAAVAAADAARRIDSAYGPVDVFPAGPGRDRVGYRMKGDDGGPVEVSFGKKDHRAIQNAVGDVIEDGGTRTVETEAGPVEVTFRGDYPGGKFTDDHRLIISPPSGGPWGVAVSGDDIAGFLTATHVNARAAGIARSIVRYSPEQPRVEAGSASGGQFAAADSGGRKKSNGDETLSYDPKSNRGTGYGIRGGDERVRKLQEALNRLGLTDQAGKPLAVDGKLGPKTTAAIKKLQKQLGVAADGKVTPEFLKKALALKGAKPAAQTSPRKTPPRKTAPKTAAAKRETKGPGRVLVRGESSVLTYDRTFPLDDIQIQRSGDGRTVEAYAAMFDQAYEVRDQHGHYMEVIQRNAFNRTLNGAGRNAMCLYNHGRNLEGQPDSMASIPLGTPLEIRPDGRGLLTVTRYNRGPYTDQVLESVRNGDIKAQSFRGGIYRSDPPGRIPRAGYGRALPTVTRHELGLTDYGPTPIPVNQGAEIVAVRSVQDLLEELAELDADEREELLRTLDLSTHDGDPDEFEDDCEDEDDEDVLDDSATSDGSGPGAEDPPAERSATHSGRLEAVRAAVLRGWKAREGASRG